MPTEHIYCHYTEQQVRESGLLTAERMAQVTQEISARIDSCFDRAGNVIPLAFVANVAAGQRLLFPRVDTANTEEYMRRSVMEAVLTEAELALINRSCMEARAAAREAEHFAKATKLDSWDGGVFSGDRYFASIEELNDSLDDKERPEWVWTAQPTRVIPSLSVADVVENDIADRGWEDMSAADLDGVDELQGALDKFVAANADVLSYRPDYSTVVLLAARQEKQLSSQA